MSFSALAQHVRSRATTEGGGRKSERVFLVSNNSCPLRSGRRRRGRREEGSSQPISSVREELLHFPLCDDGEEFTNYCAKMQSWRQQCKSSVSPNTIKKCQRLANSLLRFLVDMTAAAKTNTGCNRGWKLAGEFFSHVTNDDSLSTVSFPLLPTVHYTSGYKRNCTTVCVGPPV